VANEDIVYGPHAVQDALEIGRARRLWVLDTSDKGKAAQVREELAARAVAAGLKVERVSRQYLDTRMGRANHQGIIAKVSPFPYADFEKWLSTSRPPDPCLVVVLDGIQDPGNLGHILREAVGFAAGCVIIPEHRACAVTPTVEKTSAGYAARVPVCRVPNLTRAIEALKSSDIWCYGAEMSGATKLTDAVFHPRTAWIVGSEHSGLSRLVREACDELISIPMPGPIQSFNVATSTALGLYEYRRKYPAQ
jgi:23S rRNA (guanosine2251-2'-O)-methyltransferase